MAYNWVNLLWTTSPFKDITDHVLKLWIKKQEQDTQIVFTRSKNYQSVKFAKYKVYKTYIIIYIYYNLKSYRWFTLALLSFRALHFSHEEKYEQNNIKRIFLWSSWFTQQLTSVSTTRRLPNWQMFSKHLPTWVITWFFIQSAESRRPPLRRGAPFKAILENITTYTKIDFNNFWMTSWTLK